MAGGHNKVECCSGSHLKKSGFRSIDLSLALALSLRRGLRRIVVWGPHGASKAVWVGFWGSSICAGVTKSAGLRAAKWLFWNSEVKNVEI